MAANRTQLEQWFDEGVRQGATHMVVVCDTFDYDDYPVYVMPDGDKNAREVAEQYRGKNMQKVMEVYDLQMDKAMQMREVRTFHY